MVAIQKAQRMLGCRGQDWMKIDGQDVKCLDQCGTSRLKLVGLVWVTRQLPGFDLIGELVNAIGQGHDFANRPTVIPGIPGVSDRVGRPAQALDQLNRSARVIRSGPRGDHLPVKSLVQETSGSACDVDVLADEI